MKMVKKCMIALAVVALMVTVVCADDPSIKKDGDWPWTYKALDLCKFPVYMDVGHYVQLKECHKRELILKQLPCEGDKPDGLGKSAGDFPCYTGCEEIEVRANFPAIFGASLGNKSSILDKTDLYWKDGINQISPGDYQKLTICLDAWKAVLWKSASPDSKLKVGEITINVKPPDTGS
jgi:hypothetical protein